MKKTHPIIIIQLISLIILLSLGILSQSISYSSLNNRTTTKITSSSTNTKNTNKTKVVTSTSVNNVSTTTSKKNETTKNTNTTVTTTKKIKTTKNTTTTKKNETTKNTTTTTTKKIEKYYYYKWLNNERDYTGRTCLLIYDKDGNVSKGYAEILYYNKYLKRQYITDDIKECFLEDMKSVKILNVIVDEVKYEQ